MKVEATAGRRPYRGKLHAVILDWAGTTVDYGSCAPIHALARLFKRKHIAVNEDELRRAMGLRKKDHIRAILDIPRVAALWLQTTGRAPTEADVEELFAEFVPLQLESLASDSDLIPGVVEAVQQMRNRGLKIGSTTGYTRPMLDILLKKAAAAGYQPDCAICPDDVGQGRPYPWMCYENAVRLQVFPMEAIAKIGDTPADIEEGLNAGMWTVGVVATGNELGFGPEQYESLPPQQRKAHLERGREKLRSFGAHVVIDSLAEFSIAQHEIENLLRIGQRP